MLSRKRSILLGVASVLFLFVCLWMLSESGARLFSGRIREDERGMEGVLYRVTRSVDGDTIELEDGRKVRYIGINAPETVDPRRKVECFGREASDFNAGLVEGKRIRLEKDISETDRYGRLLRFVYLEDGGFVNEILVREGYVYASAYGPDVARKELFTEAEKDARKNRRGLWASDTCDGHRELTY